MQKQHDPGCFVINRLEKYGNAIHLARKIPWLRNEDLEFAVPFPLIREGQPLPTFTNSYITLPEKNIRNVAAFSEGKCQFNFWGVSKVNGYEDRK